MNVSIAWIAPLMLAACAGAAGSNDARALTDGEARAETGTDLTEGPPPRIVMVAGTPSHGPGEHEYHAGAKLLQRFLGEVGVQVDVVRDGWPTDPAVFAGARAIGFFADGDPYHPLMKEDRLAVLEQALATGTGFFCLHYAINYPLAAHARVLPLLGGAYAEGTSVSPTWHATVMSFPSHPATRGLVPFELDDEWYYDLAFATDRPPTPLLAAIPPDATRTTADAAMHPGRAETTAWAYERADGGRAFGYSGLHYHATWGIPSVRRMIVNAVLWTAGLDVPAGGAPVTFDPAWLLENLDPK